MQASEIEAGSRDDTTGDYQRFIRRACSVFIDKCKTYGSVARYKISGRKARLLPATGDLIWPFDPLSAMYFQRYK